MLLAAPERTSPSTAADLAISIDLSTSSESPATTFIRKSAGAPLAALCGVKQPESIASELISSRGEPSPYSDHPCVSQSTIALVPWLLSHLVRTPASSLALGGRQAARCQAEGGVLWTRMFI